MKTHFNTIVIGKGLVGAAAAKYLSLQEKSVAVIGPDEPTHYDEAVVFASHYDQARVQRLIGRDEHWTRLNRDAAAQYPSIEQQSAIHFHEAVGCLYVNPYGHDEYLQQVPVLSQAFTLPAESFSTASALNSRFTNFHFPEGATGIFESTPAGLINPRQLIKAQLKLFEQQQGTIITETATDVMVADSQFTVTTTAGNRYHADKILVAAGSFVNHFNLLPQKLALRSKSEVVLLVQLTEEDAMQLAHLPSLLYEINNKEVEGIYLIKPVLYPDGGWYLKLGCNMPEDNYFDTLEQVQQWFRETDTKPLANKLLRELNTLMPHLQVVGYTTKNCIVSYTDHRRPYIGETNTSGLFVAGGCNGYSAMCSDAIGHTAAHRIIKGIFPDGYDSKAFELVYQ